MTRTTPRPINAPKVQEKLDQSGVERQPSQDRAPGARRRGRPPKTKLRVSSNISLPSAVLPCELDLLEDMADQLLMSLRVPNSGNKE